MTALTSFARGGTLAAAEPKIFALGLALVPATSGTARGLLVPGLKLSDILVLLLAMAVLLRWRGQWKLIDGLGVAVLLYSGVYAVLTTVNFARRTELSITLLPYEMAGAPQYVLVYLLAYAIGQKSRTIMTWLRPSMVIACGMAVIAALQVADIGPTREILAFVTGRDKILHPLAYQAYRGTAFFPSQHALGMYLCIHAVIAAVCLGRTRLGMRDRRLLMMTLLLTGVGILSTATGTPTVIYSAALIVFLLSTRNALWVLSGAIILSTAASLTPIGQNIAKRVQIQYGDGGGGSFYLPKSFWFRVEVWLRDFVPIIQDNIWTGYGPVPENSNLFPYMESMYITVLMQGGILLLIALVVVLLLAVIRMSVATSTFAPDHPSLVNPSAHALRFTVVLLTIFMVIHPYLSDAGAAPMFFTALGMISGLAAGVLARGESPGADKMDVQAGPIQYRPRTRLR